MKTHRKILIFIIAGTILILVAYYISVYVQPLLQPETNFRLFTFFLAVTGVITVIGAAISGINDYLEISQKISRSKENRNNFDESLTSYSPPNTSNLESSKITENLHYQILIIENDLNQRRELADLLRNCGYKVRTVASVKHAIAVVRKVNCGIGVVLADIHMPGELDGIDAINEIQLICPNIQFIIISAYPTNKSYRERVYREGLIVMGWVDKPLINTNKRVLLNLLEIALQNN